MRTELLKNATKQAIAFLMLLTMIFSMIPLTTVAAESADGVDNIFVDGAKSFGVNKLYSTGLLAVGKMLTSVADATDNETFRSVASFINVWVCGGNNTSQSLAEIEDLCNEILDGVKEIDEKLDAYTTILLTKMAEDRLKELQSSMNLAWDSDVDIPTNTYTRLMSSTLNDYMNYFSAVNDYMNGKEISDVNITKKSDETFDEYQMRIINYKRMCVFTDFCSMHGGISDNLSKEERETILFAYDDNKVDDFFQNTIKLLYEKLRDTRYDFGEESAQFAYNSFPNLSDQYDYVISNINKHFMWIAEIEMLYQEYLSMRGEYLQTNYPNDTKMWDEYRLKVYGDTENGVLGLAGLNRNVIKAMEDYLDSEFSLETLGKKIRIDQYPKQEDLIQVTRNGSKQQIDKRVRLKNTKYYSNFSNYLSEEVIKDYYIVNSTDFSKCSSSAKITSEYMYFHKIPIYTSNGIEMYYLLDGDQSTLSTKYLVEKDNRVGRGVYLPTCDFYNLTKGVYSDGSNTFTCPNLPQNESALFNSGSYSFYGNIPYNYLDFNNYYNSGSSNGNWTKNIYQIFSKYSYIDDGGFADPSKPCFSVLNMSNECVTTDLEKIEVKKLDGINDIIKSEESSPYYTTVLQKSSTELVNTVSAYVNNPDDNYIGKNNNIYIKRADGTIAENGTEIPCGEKLTLYMSESAGYVLNSLKICRYNDMQNPDVATSTEEILDQYDFDSLNFDEETKCYMLDVTMPYSNCDFVLETVKGYRVNVINETSDTTLTFDSDKTVFESGENVAFTCTGEVYSIEIEYGYNGGLNKYVTLTYDAEKDISIGEFRMPDSNVTLTLNKMSVSTLPEDDEGNFVIRTYEDLCGMSTFVNTGNERYVKGNYLLVNDIVVPNDVDWIPINNFNGTFEGNNYSISNLNNINDVEVFGLFKYVNESAIIQNLNITDVNFKISSGKVSSGVLCAENNGKISNCSTSGEVIVERNDEQASINVSVGGICNCNYGEIVDSHSDCNIAWENESFKSFMYSNFSVGGICAMNFGSITHCYNTGDVSFTGGITQIGGLVGYNHSTTGFGLYADITDCYNTGNIKVDFDLSNVDIDAVNVFIDNYNTSDEYNVNNVSELITLLDKEFDRALLFSVGGLVGYDEYSNIKNCHNYGDVYSFIVGSDGLCHRTNATNIENCYYVVSDDTAITDETMKNKSQFASGEVTYLLNNEVTDGTQVWYQNVDNPKKHDVYPVFSGGTVYNIGTDEYSNCEEVDYEFESDANGNLIISTYDNLVKLSELVISDYDTYGSENYILTDNIIAPQGSKWKHGIGSVEENKPFNGTFDGNGYIIARLNVATDDYGGLFEYIGDNGKVSQILALAFSFSEEIKTAGVFAAVNNGVIDHCISGANLSSSAIFIDWNSDGVKEKVIASVLNSKVQGETSGGIAAVNNGKITGCRNASVFNNTKLSGGIAGENNGTIYGCANTGSISSVNTVAIGGIAGKNTGTIETSYNSAKMYGGSDNNQGSVVGINQSENVSNVFYVNTNGLKPVGIASTVALNETNILKSGSEMKTDEFVDVLNKLTNDENITWTRNETRNNSYPTIQCQFYKLAKRLSRSGISVTGRMHKDLNIEYFACDDNCEESALYASYGNVVAVYDLDVTDSKGNDMLQELWSEGQMKISVPISDDSVRLLTSDNEGNVSEINYTVEDGNAVFYTENIQSIALISAKVSNADNTVNDNKNSSSISVSDNTSVKTGTAMLSLASVAIIAMFAAFVFIQRRKYNER